MAEIEFITGHGTDPRANPKAEVTRWSRFPRGPAGTCAFCLGDPCNEFSSPDSVIAQFYAVAPDAVTCPVCDGQAT